VDGALRNVRFRRLFLSMDELDLVSGGGKDMVSPTS
jgi:hypothetical protein